MYIVKLMFVFFLCIPTELYPCRFTQMRLPSLPKPNLAVVASTIVPESGFSRVYFQLLVLNSRVSGCSRVPGSRFPISDYFLDFRRSRVPGFPFPGSGSQDSTDCSPFPSSAFEMASELIAALQENPHDSETHAKLIEVLRTQCEGTDPVAAQALLQQHRDDFATRFLPGPEFWLDWISDQVASSSDSLSALSAPSPSSSFTSDLDALFQRALSQCPHHSIVQEYVDNAGHRLEAELATEDDVRKVLEAALAVSGGDILTGAALWERLTELEMDELDDLVDTSAPAESVRKAKEAVVQTFRRQFSLPLLGNNRALATLERVLSDICVASDAEWIKPDQLLEKYKRSEGQLAKRILFEQKVSSEDFVALPLAEQAAAWRAYIQFEADDNQLTRAQRLYERAVLACPQSKDLWAAYVDFAENTVKQWTVVDSVAERAVKVHRHAIEFWQIHLVAMETAGTSSKATPLHQQYEALDGFVSAAVSAALCCTFSSADDYLSVLLHACDFQRRKLQQYVAALGPTSPTMLTLTSTERKNLAGKAAAAVASLRAAFDTAERVVHAYYPEWGTGWLTLYKYRAAAEDEAVGDAAALMEQLGADAAGVDVDALGSTAGQVWERAVARFPKYAFAWVEFTRWARSAGDVDLCRALYQRSLKSVRDCPDEMARAYVAFEAQAGRLEDLHTAKKLTKKILKAAEATAAAAAASASAAVVAAPGAKDAKAKAKDGKKPAAASGIRAGSAVSAPGTVPATAPAAKAVKRSATDVDDAAAGGNSNGNGNGNVAKRQKTAHPADTAVAATAAAGNGAAVSASAPAASADGANPTVGAAPEKPVKGANHHPTTVFVSKLPADMTDYALQDLFASCGEVHHAKVAYDKKTGVSKGHALVQFVDEAGKHAALGYNKKALGGHTLSVLPSKFPAVSDDAPTSHYGPPRALPPPPPSSSSSGDSAASKPAALLMFKPRGLQQKKPCINL